MSKNRKEYIAQLFDDLKLLEERLLSVKESDTLPFSFFSLSFDRIERMSRSLHELELIQIGEMKEQMERLVRFLSESDSRDSVSNEPANTIEKEVAETESESAFVEQERVSYVDSLGLPTYRDPRITKPSPALSADIDSRITETASALPSDNDAQITEPAPPVSAAAEVDVSEGEEKPISVETAPEHSEFEKNGKEKPAVRSLNDIIQAPPALLNLKRGISLNDRFLFQRELFDNNRTEMNSVMDRLNTFGSFEEAEDYLRREKNWNFEEQTVKEFLLVIKKGFE